jgi:heterodisulfide reductase subunit A
MITAMDLEVMLRQGKGIYRPSDGEPPDSIAFVQCVGSRDPRRGHPYCSQVCCPYALRMAGCILEQSPGTPITFFYMDIQSFGKSFAETWPGLQQEIRWIREIPGEYFLSQGDRVGVSVEVEEDMTDLSFDLMVLSIGMSPPEDQPWVRESLHLPLSAEGFLLPYEKNGVFVIGSASGPMDIQKSITHALATVPRVIAHMEGAE